MVRLALALGLFAAITAARFASDNPADAIGILFVVPIAMIALDFRWPGGLVAGAVGTLISVVWALLQHMPVTVVGYGARTVAFVSVGVGIGVIAAQRERSLRDAARWFEMSNDLLCTIKFDGYLTDVNESWTALLGHSRDVLLSGPLAAIVHPDDAEPTRRVIAGLATPSELVGFENRCRAHDGSWHWLLWSCRSDGHLIYAAVKDVTERKEREAEREELLATMEQLAQTDGLTGALNRATWPLRLDDELARSERSGAPVSVLMLDIDRFKAINDTEGHAAGDRTLTACASGWLAALRSVDTLGRVGGDEFAVLLPNCDADAARLVAERIRSATPDGVTCSMGFARWDRAETAEQLLHRADEALYRAKQEGRDRLVV